MSLVDRILMGESIQSVLTEDAVMESNEKDIVDANNMVSDWLKENTYDHNILNRETQHKITFEEIDPDGSTSKSYFIIKSDGKMYNANDDEVTGAALDANDDPEIKKMVTAFRNKWYK